MRVRSPVLLVMVGIAAALVVLLLGSRRTSMPLTLEMVGFTNLSPAVPALPLWTARDAHGEVSGLTSASPSHVLFKVCNQTGRPLRFRPLMYQFADSVPAGVAVPQGPSRHRGGRISPTGNFPRGLGGYKGMSFGPSHGDCITYRPLPSGETALMALPRPPFDCTWRPAVAYELPLTRLQTLKHIIKQRLRLQELHNVFGAPQGFYYDEWIYGAWLTNAVLTR